MCSNTDKFKSYCKCNSFFAGITSSGRIESEKTSSWELAVVTSPSNTNNTNTISHAKPVSDDFYFELVECWFTTHKQSGVFVVSLAGLWIRQDVTL